MSDNILVARFSVWFTGDLPLLPMPVSFYRLSLNAKGLIEGFCFVKRVFTKSSNFENSVKELQGYYWRGFLSSETVFVYKFRTRVLFANSLKKGAVFDLGAPGVSIVNESYGLFRVFKILKFNEVFYKKIYIAPLWGEAMADEYYTEYVDFFRWIGDELKSGFPYLG